MFGMERHTPSCTCPNCNPTCAHNWNEGADRKGPNHTCIDKVNEHTSDHHCQCGQTTRRRAEALNWWDPKVQRRKREREAAEGGGN